MNLGNKLPRYLVVVVLTAGLGIWIWLFAEQNGGFKESTVKVTLPKLSALATNGKMAFDANCAKCHGPNATGTDVGPPLVHDIYNPGHHSDAAFFVAATIGVPQHHWPYGDMPPQHQVSEQQIAAIVQYVRELQVANGIGYRPHNM